MTESTIRYILLFIGILFISGICWDGLRRGKQTPLVQKEEKEVSEEKKELESEPEMEDMEEEQEIETKEDDKEEDDDDDLTLKEEEPTIEEEIKIEEDEPILNESVLDELADFNKEEIMPEKNSDIISLYVTAPEEKTFGGYDLLQTILANDMQYGDMQIFHRYADKNTKTKLLFSLVSANEPGDFNLQEIGAFSCKGLILFMNTSKLDRPLQAFNAMLKTATHLAEDLGGELKLNQNKILTEETIKEIRQSLRKNIPEI